MTDQSEFRRDVRAWLKQNCPESMRGPSNEMPQGGRHQTWPNPDARLWLERMAARGFTVPDWPREYGGAGLDRARTAVLREEMVRLGCRPPLGGMGVWMFGPMLLTHGTEEQRAEHLPRIARGEIRWCQGYSEPGAGSDLASLSTRAEDHGDYFLVNGSKIWTSGADHADWIYCLVRTDPSAPKHDGISMLLFDMTSPGVSTRPIRLISGASPFCQTFFDNVRVPRSGLVGGEAMRNKGWTIGKALLQHERNSAGTRDDSLPWALPELLRRYTGDSDRITDPALRASLIRQRMNFRAAHLLNTRLEQGRANGESPGLWSSVLKYYKRELDKDEREIAIRAMGSAALGWELPGSESKADSDALAITRSWLASKAWSIAGGSAEVQLNIIAKRMLGLPD